MEIVQTPNCCQAGKLDMAIVDQGIIIVKWFATAHELIEDGILMFRVDERDNGVGVVVALDQLANPEVCDFARAPMIVGGQDVTETMAPLILPALAMLPTERYAAPDISPLDELGELRDKIAFMAVQQQQEIEALMGAELLSKITAVKARWMEEREVVEVRAKELEDRVKADVAAYGQSVTGARLQAVYAAGRVTWDAKFLEGLAESTPSIMRARTQGEPSVSIRTRK